MTEKKGWTYVVVRRPRGDGDGDFFAIHELHTGEGKKGLTVEPVAPQGDTLEELGEDLKMMMAALKKPPVDYKDN